MAYDLDVYVPVPADFACVRCGDGDSILNSCNRCQDCVGEPDRQVDVDDFVDTSRAPYSSRVEPPDFARM